MQIEISKNKEAIICEKYFEKNVKRDCIGIYIYSENAIKRGHNVLREIQRFFLKILNSLWNRFLERLSIWNYIGNVCTNTKD